MPIVKRSKFVFRLNRRSNLVGYISVGAIILLLMNVIFIPLPWSPNDCQPGSKACTTLNGLFKSGGRIHCPIQTLEEANGKGQHLRAVVVTSYLRKCGIATFSSDFRDSLLSVLDSNSTVDIILMKRAGQGVISSNNHEVKFIINEWVLDDYIEAAAWIDANNYDVVYIQHEYGIFGGVEGGYVLEFVHRLATPFVVTAHTVLKQAPFIQWKILFQLSQKSIFIANINPSGCNSFRMVYQVANDKCNFIPHGIPQLPYVSTPDTHKPALMLQGRKVILVFGLLSPAKGLANVIAAMKQVAEKEPEALLLIVGEQHPDLQSDYLGELQHLAFSYGIRDSVEFRTFFPSNSELQDYLAASDVFLTYYPNEDQVSSGTLSIALGAGVLCVSTPYAYAKAALGDGRGILVENDRVDLLADALIRALGDVSESDATRCRGYQWTRSFVWHNVALRYINLVQKHRLQHASVNRVCTTGKISQQLSTYIKSSLTDLSSLKSSVDIAHRIVLQQSLGFKLTTDDFMHAITVFLGNRRNKHYSLRRGIEHGSLQLRVPPANPNSVSLSNGRMSIAVSPHNGYLYVLEGNEMNRGIMIGAGELHLTINGHEYVWRTMDTVSKVTTDYTGTCRSASMHQPIQRDEDVTHIAMLVLKAELCDESAHVTITHTLQSSPASADIVYISDMKIVTAIDNLSTFVKGWTFNKYTAFTRDSPIHRTRRGDEQTVFTASSASQSLLWEALYSSHHASAILVGFENRPSVFVEKVYNSLGGESFHWFKHVHTKPLVSPIINLSDDKSVVLMRVVEHVSLLGRVWTSEIGSYRNALLENKWDLAVPENVGIITRAMTSFCQVDSMPRNAIHSTVMSTLGMLSSVEYASHTTLPELVDAVDALWSLSSCGVALDYGSIIRHTRKMINLLRQFVGDDGMFMCRRESTPRLHCHYAAVGTLCRVAPVLETNEDLLQRSINIAMKHTPTNPKQWHWLLKACDMCKASMEYLSDPFYKKFHEHCKHAHEHAATALRDSMSCTGFENLCVKTGGRCNLMQSMMCLETWKMSLGVEYG